MNTSKKVLAVLLTIATLIGIFSCATPVFATDITESENIKETVNEYTKQTENKALYEIKEERDKFTKVFLNSNGTKTAVVSATPLHYETDNGWEDIDNTLIEETKVTGNIYKNKKNDFTVTIPKELSENKEIKVEKHGYEISFELEGSDLFSKSKKIKANKNNQKQKYETLDNDVKTDFLDKTAGICFENIGENTSVEYEVTSTGLKENIVLNQKPEEQVLYSYKITAKKLDAQLNADNSVTFKNEEGQAVFEIPAPIMYDADNKFSNDIEVILSGKNGKFTMTYKPSFEWLCSNVSYPVVIDPVINTINEDLGIKDTVADSANPNTNYKDSSILSTYKSDTGNVQSFIDISSSYIVKNGAKIKTVLLGLYYEGGIFIDDSTTVAAYTVTSDWTESGLTYNNRPTTVDSLIERRAISRNTNAGYIYLDVTKAYTLKEDTYGVCIRQRDTVTNEAQLIFSSSETATSSQQPFFAVEYYESQGVEEQFDYHAFDVGRAGTVYYNDFTDQIYIERDELGLSGINMPVQIKRYFNSGLGGTYSTNYFGYFDIASSCGYGWRTNYNQTIEYHKNIDGKETILYCNGNGQTMYFAKTDTVDSKGIRTWEEVPDMFSNSDGYTLYLSSTYDGDVANSLKYATIKDSGGQTYEFNSNGLLIKINSAEEDSISSITITYAEGDYKIQKITDGAGREYRFTYIEDENWMFPLLTSIQAFSPGGTAITVTNESGEKVPYKMSYTYYFSDYLGTEGLPMLASATYPDGESVHYTIKDTLVKVKNIDGYTIEFDIGAGIIISEKVYDETGINYVAGGELSVLDVNAYEKTFIDINGISVTKQYDMYGRVINTTNPDGSIVARTYNDDYKAQGSVSYSFYNSYEQSFTGEETNLVTNGSFTTDLSGWEISSTSKVKRNASYDCKPNNTTPGSLQMSGVRDTAHYAAQIIDIENGVLGDEYRLDYFVKNTTHSHMVVDLLQFDTIIIEGRNKIDGDEAWTHLAYVDANPFNNNWQKYSCSFDVDFDYNEIRVIICFFDQYGTVRYDDISLVNTYKATASQSTESGTDSGTDSGTENDNSDTNTEASDNIGCDCDGCSTPDCPCTTCSDTCTLPYCNRGYKFENTSEGTSFSITDGVKTMSMEQNVSGNYYGSQKDINGIYTGYSYNQLNGQLNSMSNGEGDVTSFGYDAMSRLNKVTNTVDGLTSGNKMETSYKYDNDRIESITHNGFSYNYEYNVWGNPTAVKVGEQSLVSYTYDLEDKTRDRVNRITYGNGDYTNYIYNDDGNIDKIQSYSADNILTAEYCYFYNENGNIERIRNVLEDTELEYTDNGYNIINLNKEGQEDAIVYSKYLNDEKTVENLSGLSYTENERVVNSDGVSGTTTTSTSFTTPTNTYNLSEVTDYFGRTENKSFSYAVSEENGVKKSVKNSVEYIYRDRTDENGKVFTSSQVTGFKTTVTGVVESDSESSAANENVLAQNHFLYEYDDNGNIIKISSVQNSLLTTATEICSYIYDEVGQLVRENDVIAEITSVYVYDKGGNLVQRKIYEYTTGELPEEPDDIWEYTYDSVWKDKLIAFEDFQIDTDAIGNPLNYFTIGISDEISGTLEWNGRQLSAVTVGGERYEYSYNSDGLRTKAVFRDSQTNEINSVFNYFWENGKMTGYCTTDADGNVAAVLKNFFDNSGEQIGYEIHLVEDNEYIRFFFEKNLQGDIIGVYNEEGEKVLTYWYDSWGNVSPTYNKENSDILAQSVLAVIFTPITYRGYMYDPNTGLYYLQSRYYNPTYGRFLNADSIMKTGEPLGANIFAYCVNNPVNFVDYDGYSSKNLVDLIVEFIVLLIVTEAAMRYLFKDVVFDKAMSLKQDWNGLYSIKMRYVTETRDKEWLTLEFGDHEAWENSSFFINENTSMYFEMQGELIYDEAMSIGNGGSVYTIIYTDILIIAEVVGFSIKYAPYKTIFEKVWGKQGLDPDNIFMYYAYRVTGDKRFNGAYAFSLVKGKWEVLSV